MLTPAMFAIFNFLGVWSYRITDFVIPIAALYEAFAFVAILFMILAYTLPSSGKLDDQIAFFQQHPRLGYRDFRRIYWRMVQFLPVTLICVIATEITMATNCVGGRSWKRANLVIHIVEEISTVLAITGLFKGYNKLKLDMKKVQPGIFGQIFIFKVIVFLQLVQGLLISILRATGALNPTSTISYNDANLGLEPFMVCCEALIISLGMLYFYDSRKHGGDYVRANDRSFNKNHVALEEGTTQKALSPKLSPLKALWDVVNICDIFQGMGNAMWLLGHRDITRQP